MAKKARKKSAAKGAKKKAAKKPSAKPAKTKKAAAPETFADKIASSFRAFLDSFKG